MTTLQALPGVQHVPPPAKLIPDLQHSMSNALTLLQGDQRVAVLGMVTVDKDGRKSANAVLVTRLGQGEKWDLDSVLFFGKTWGERVEGSAMIRFTR